MVRFITQTSRVYYCVILLLFETGNAFGEEGIELLRESLEAKGLIDILGTLSDDEGGESEEEEEEEGESEGGDDSLVREKVSREGTQETEEDETQLEQSKKVRSTVSSRSTLHA